MALLWSELGSASVEFPSCHEIGTSAERDERHKESRNFLIEIDQSIYEIPGGYLPHRRIKGKYDRSVDNGPMRILFQYPSLPNIPADMIFNLWMIECDWGRRKSKCGTWVEMIIDSLDNESIFKGYVDRFMEIKEGENGKIIEGMKNEKLYCVYQYGRNMVCINSQEIDLDIYTRCSLDMPYSMCDFQINDRDRNLYARMRFPADRIGEWKSFWDAAVNLLNCWRKER